MASLDAVRRTVRFGVAVALLSTCFTVAGMPSAHAAAKPWPHNVVAGFSTPSGGGYWLVFADGTVTRKGDARLYGDASRVALVKPIVGGAATPSGKGYWLVAGDGGVFTFGNAHFYGSMGGAHLRQPVFTIAPTRTGKGYWLVARDGGVFTFAVYPIVGFATSPTDSGYQMIGRDAYLKNFGKFPVPDHLRGRGLNHGVDNVMGLMQTPTKRGEWIVFSDGGTFAFGNARQLKGPPYVRRRQIVAAFSNPKAQGYVLVTSTGAIFRFGAAPG
jgi:hypothetical protein